MKRKWIHKLSNINTIDKTAICEKCGLVKVIKRAFRRKDKIQGWRCYEAHHSRNVNYYRSDIIGLPEIILRNGKCPICKKQSKLTVDHCHKTNKFRGFICNKCNSILGFANDNVILFKSAIAYLLRV